MDLLAMGARVVSTYGLATKRVLIEMPAEAATDLFPERDLLAARRAHLLDAVQRDIDAIRRRAPELADSALAASALAMALEIEHPWNSATSKSMCQAQLAKALRELRELAPPEETNDALDEVKEQRAKRRARVAGSAGQAGP